MNYGLRILQLGIFLMQLNGIEKEADGDRALRNWKSLMLYFRAHSRALSSVIRIFQGIMAEVKALRKANEDLKNQIEKLTKDFNKFGEVTQRQTVNQSRFEASEEERDKDNSVQFLSDKYDELLVSNNENKKNYST